MVGSPVADTTRLLVVLLLVERLAIGTRTVSVVPEPAGAGESSSLPSTPTWKVISV